MKYFQSLLNPIGAPGVNLEDKDMPRLTNRPVLDPIMLNEEISIEEIKDAIHANRDNKSPGTDGIKPAFIENDAFVRFVHALCNHCFKTGTVDSWLKAIIKPIPQKSKESTIPSEYRGIALQSFVAKSSLVPMLSWGRGKESLVTTACSCANPYQQNMVSQFSRQNGLSRG